MRIIAGDWRGRPIAGPEGMATRPTSDRAREGLFSMLASRVGSFEGLYVADLFAGSGALGLEALSRGAAFCLFVDNERAAVEALSRNAERLGARDRIEIRTQSIQHAAPPPRPADLVFMDPPYGRGLAQLALDRLCDPAWLAPGAWLSLESEGEAIAIPRGLSKVTERRFGKAHITLLQKSA